MIESLMHWLDGHGVSAQAAEPLATAIFGISLLLLAAIANWITRRLVATSVRRIAARTAVTWDDVFVENRLLERLSLLVPLLILHAGAPLALSHYPELVALARTLVLALITITAIMILDGTLNSLLQLYDRTPISNQVPAKGFVQLLKVLMWAIGGVFVISHLIGRSPLALLGGLGAFTAVLLLIFKDPILGLVAGIQISGNDMVRKGDWIEMPKYGADGDVVDISLTTVKVRNWDKTITTIPSYALVSDSFKNWRGMQESGGRRIKRAISIDMNSVRFVDDALLERLRRFQALRPYLDERVAEIERHNRDVEADPSEPINGRRMTNLGCLRAYLVAYLRKHPQVRQDMTFLVRQLAPGPNGIPLEIYVFSAEQRWAEYEGIMGDIFDHLIASVPLFDLRVFQAPTGADVRALRA